MRAAVVPPSIAQGAEGKVTLTINIKPPYHINANPASFEYLIPTKATLSPPEGIEAGAPLYPPGALANVGGFDEKILVYDGVTSIILPLRVAKNCPPGTKSIEGKLSFQACDEKSCFPPKEISFSLTLEVTARGEILIETAPTPPIDAAPSIPQVFKPDSIVFAIDSTVSNANAAPAGQFEGKGLLMLILLSYLGGLSLNLTPCVYPLIPVTAGYFARQAGGRKRTFLLAFLFVISMAVVYSIFGTIAALSGSFFGGLLQHPAVLVFISVIMVAMALAMFGLYDINLPGWLNALTDSRPGAGGAIFMGATMGIAAGPCVGPFLAALLAYVGARGNPLEGFILFFSLGIGMGTPYIPLALVAQSITRFPRAGAFLVIAKRMLGLVLLAVAAWFLLPLTGTWVFGWLSALILIGGGSMLLFFGADGESGRTRAFRMLAGGALIALAVARLFSAPDAKESLQWAPYSNAEFRTSVEAGRPVIIDFSADWCIPCHELDAVTFSDPDVIAAINAGSFALLKADMTGPDLASDVAAVAEHFDVQGVPTVVFIGRGGRVLEQLTLTGFEGPGEFLKRVEEAKK